MLFVIFTTVLVDLIGFGMVIPLVGLYGRHFGASSFSLAILGGTFSLIQFLSAPFWGLLSDRIGRRPVLLVSILGQAASYFMFAAAGSIEMLIACRALAGLFSGNISAAQAAVADVTSAKDRAKGMGIIGAAFGLGFTLGPPLGGIASAKLGLAAPGIIAGAICVVNFLVATFRFPETLKPGARAAAARRKIALWTVRLPNSTLAFLIPTFFFATFSFSNMEQTFSLWFQTRFGFETSIAGYKTGLVLMVSGLVGAAIQGGAIRKLVPRFGEWRLMNIGLALQTLTMLVFPLLPSYESYFVLAIPMAFGSALLNPSLSALISRSAPEDSQGEILGLTQGAGSLARAAGPFAGLLLFSVSPAYPYWLASGICLTLTVLAFRRGRQNRQIRA